QVCRLADRRVIHLQVAPDGAHDYVPRVQTNSYLDRNAVGPSNSLSVPFHGFLHPKGCIAGSHGVIFVSKRRTKERHNPVTHDLIDSPFVTMDSLHHMFEDRVEKFARFLRISVS